MSSTLDLSIVIPLLNEEESLEQLVDWIDATLSSRPLNYEILLIDDGSTDRSWEVIDALSRKRGHINAIQFSRNYGKSQALNAGFAAAQGNVVITMDADLQDSPEEIPELYRMIVDEKYDLVSGWKRKRYDNVLFKNLPSKLFNWAARRASGLKLHDFNCGLKAYRREVTQQVDVYGEMHRYIPVLAAHKGFTRITEKEVKHQARQFGVTKFGSERFIRGFLDLLTISFLTRFGNRPMHFFGTLGGIMVFLGVMSAAYIGLEKLGAVYNGNPMRLVTNSPWFYISLTTILIGTQLFIAGFLGELIQRNRGNKKRYVISRSIKPRFATHVTPETTIA